MAHAGANVTVFIAVFNGEQFLEETIASVLAQTYRNFELLVVDDCSTDRTAEILRAIDDPRLRVERNERNRGRTYTRNRGLQLARGEFLAVLDADDLCEPERLAKCVAFLDSHPQVAAVGSAATYVDEGGRPLFVNRVPTDSALIRSRMFTVNCFVHSSVTMRRRWALAVGGYDERLSQAEDYDLLLRLGARHPLANLPEPLVRYRIHGGQVSQQKLAVQRKLADAVRVEAFEAQQREGLIGPGVQPPDVSFVSSLLGRRGTLAADCLHWAGVHRALGNQGVAARLVARAILSAPLCSRAWRASRWALLPLVLPDRVRNAVRWYARKAVSRLRAP